MAQRVDSLSIVFELPFLAIALITGGANFLFNFITFS